ncbi:hypothetical protein [Leptospira noguchii]|uniref:hypothetical protein n=1 Tax=Leptospira noguchii TaxID=28182 RepID=UPI00055C8131|nr:hypothetical protein [Leptospira noguchii]
MNYFYRQFISHITVVYVVVLSHDITGGATTLIRSSMPQISKDFGVYLNTLINWKKKCLTDDGPFEEELPSRERSIEAILLIVIWNLSTTLM